MARVRVDLRGSESKRHAQEKRRCALGTGPSEEAQFCHLDTAPSKPVRIKLLSRAGDLVHSVLGATVREASSTQPLSFGR